MFGMLKKMYRVSGRITRRMGKNQETEFRKLETQKESELNKELYNLKNKLTEYPSLINIQIRGVLKCVQQLQLSQKIKQNYFLNQQKTVQE